MTVLNFSTLLQQKKNESPNEARTDPSKEGQDAAKQQPPPKGFRRYTAFVKRHWIISSAAATLFILLIILTLALVFTLGTKGQDAIDLQGSSNHLPSYPLAVKNPYLSTWVSADSELNVTAAETQFWTEEKIAWNVLARVGSAGIGSAITYSLFGHPKAVPGTTPAIQRGPVNYTSTHTTVKLDAGPAEFILDFFSPVSPNNLTRHSMPYSYLTISVTSSSKTDVQIFNAIDHTWSGASTDIDASLTSDAGTTMFTLANANAMDFTEASNRAAWGTTVFASQSKQSSLLTAACDTPQTIHSDFAHTGSLGGQTATANCSGDDVFALAHQLQNVKDSKSVTFAIGLYRENAVNYLGKAQTPYFRSQFKTLESSLDAFFNDYSSAWQESQQLDKLIRNQAMQVGGSNYSDIVEASVRQAFGALEIVIPADTLSTAPEDINGFLKEISSDGNVNSVDVIYPTFPMFYVLCPQWIKYMVQPILEYLNHPSGVWDLATVPHDLGDHYPNATGHNDNQLEFFQGREEWMPIEVTASMFSMLLAYTNATGDYDFIKQYMGPNGNYLLTTYADALVKNGSDPAAQLTTVDSLVATANTTQLAIQAAIGVSAMGAMSNMTNYTTLGAQMTDRILNDQSLGAIGGPNKTHFTYSCGDSDSFSVMFPLFADKLANLAPANSFAPSYTMQSNFYKQQLIEHPLGIPYSNRQKWAVVDWNMWSAGITDAEVTKKIIDSTHLFLRTMKAGVAFGTKYLVDGPNAGAWVGNTARPTVGSNFALMALKGHSLKW